MHLPRSSGPARNRPGPRPCWRSADALNAAFPRKAPPGQGGRGIALCLNKRKYLGVRLVGLSVPAARGIEGVADMGFRDFLRQVVLPSRDKLRNGAAPYLEPEEQIQAVFRAARPMAWEGRQDCVVVVTDRRILLLDLDFFANPLGLYFLARVTRRCR